MKASRAEHLPHRAYSPDLALNELFLFEYIKRKLFDSNRESREDLLNTITAILIGIDQEMLASVLKCWVDRLTWAIKHDGKYYTKESKNKRHFFKISRKTGGSELMYRP
jgi:hypothetical protein